jgi:hypothetical protein
MRPTNHSFLILLLMTFFSFFGNAQESQNKVMICYGDFFPEKIKGYQFVIVEPSYFSKSDVQILKSNNTSVLAYISLGEVDQSSDYFSLLKDVTIGTNPIWSSYILDLSNPKTRSVLSGKIDSYMTDKGFDGLFLDNIDNFVLYGPTPEQRPILLSFLKDIRSRYPKLFMMQNAGLELLSDSHTIINALAIESIASDYDFRRKHYRLRAKSDFRFKSKQLSEVAKNYKLPIVVIEYSDSKYLNKHILKRIENMGWYYFIGTIDLQNIPK